MHRRHLPYARRMDGMKASEIRELLKLIDRPEVISFAGGIPDPALFPGRGRPRRLCRGPARSRRGAAIWRQRGLSRRCATGSRPQMTRDGVAARRRKTSSSPPARSRGSIFSARRCFRRATRCCANIPTYLGALQAFSAYEPRYDRLRLGGGNRTPASYTARGERAVKALYLVPDFANPTGLSLSLRRARGRAGARARTRRRRHRGRRLSRAALRRRRRCRACRRSTSRDAAASRLRASSISALSPRRSRRGCGSAGSARRAS